MKTFNRHRVNTPSKTWQAQRCRGDHLSTMMLSAAEVSAVRLGHDRRVDELENSTLWFDLGLECVSNANQGWQPLAQK
jgi:hypothetical protein